MLTERTGSVFGTGYVASHSVDLVALVRKCLLDKKYCYHVLSLNWNMSSLDILSELKPWQPGVSDNYKCETFDTEILKHSIWSIAGFYLV